ncbi:MAG TPA: MFS transporter [Candidatus Acidoferrum sp.]|nr:MFS transporter [Candidatus Acidoferrum sp.]
MNASAPVVRHGAFYQSLLTALLSLNFGLVLFDRNATGFLMPFIQPELGLDNSQVGMLSSALSLTWAVSAFGIGLIANRFSRKTLLVLTSLAFSLCSVMSGLAGSFMMLFATRLLMGLAEGGIMPVSQAMIHTEISPLHRGLAMGVAQGFGSSLMGSFVAPVVLVAFATALGWRNAFFLTALPGLVTVALMAALIKPPLAAPVQQVQTQRMAWSVLFGNRNIVLCVLIGILLVSYLVVCWAFMPLYLTQVSGYDAETMGWLMGALGISATIASTAIPAWSDRIGRRWPMIVLPAIGMILPLAALYYSGSTWSLAALFAIGWAVTGVFPLFMATIPSESISESHVAAALGLCMGSSEILGGVLSPTIAGIAADKFGLQAPLWMLFLFSLVAGVLALGIRETAPKKLAQ